MNNKQGSSRQDAQPSTSGTSTRSGRFTKTFVRETRASRAKGGRGRVDDGPNEFIDRLAYLEKKYCKPCKVDIEKNDVLKYPGFAGILKRCQREKRRQARLQNARGLAALERLSKGSSQTMKKKPGRPKKSTAGNGKQLNVGKLLRFNEPVEEKSPRLRQLPCRKKPAPMKNFGKI